MTSSWVTNLMTTNQQKIVQMTALSSCPNVGPTSFATWVEHRCKCIFLTAESILIFSYVYGYTNPKFRTKAPGLRPRNFINHSLSNCWIQYESSVKWYLNSNGSRVSMVVADIMATIWRQVIYKYHADLPAGTTSFWRDNDAVITSYVRWATAFGSNVTLIQESADSCWFVILKFPVTMKQSVWRYYRDSRVNRCWHTCSLDSWI